MDRVRAWAGLGAAAVLLAGCGGDDDDVAPEPEAQTAPVTEDEPPVDASTDDPSPDEEGTPDRPSPPPSSTSSGPVLASVSHPVALQGGTLDIELRAEEVGELLRVELTFTPRDIGDERTTLADLLGSVGGGNGVSGRLIDPVNLLEYETVRAVVSHGQATPAFADQPTTLNFYFGAPVEPLETFDFLLDFVVGVPEWPGFVDVPFGDS